MGDVPQLMGERHGIFRVLGVTIIITGRCSSLLVDSFEFMLNLLCLLAFVPNIYPVLVGLSGSPSPDYLKYVFRRLFVLAYRQGKMKCTKTYIL